MTLHRRIFLATGAAAMAPAIGRSQTLTQASFRLKWLPQSQFAGYYLALSRGYYRDAGIDLTINPGGPNLLTENPVAAGTDTFGVSGGTESVMIARQKALPITCFGIAHQVTPFVFVVRKDGPIKTVKDLPGHRATAWFTGAQLVLAGILAAQGVPRDAVSISAQQVSFTPFINGDVDLVTATSYSDVALLRSRMGPDSLRIFVPEDYGITVPRDTLIMSEKTMADQPALAQGFLRATIRGWQAAKQDPAAAVDAVLKIVPTLDPAVETATLGEILKLMAAGPAATKGLFEVDRPTIQRTHDFLLKYGAITQPIDLNAAFTTRFVDAIPAAERMP